MKRQFILGSFTTLALGGLIYILFRASSLRMFIWLETIGLGEAVGELRNFAIQVAIEIPEWILFSLPDGLWVFSFVSLILLIWGNTISMKVLLWILLVPLIAIGSEVGQLLGYVSGTFDLVDLLLYFLGSTVPPVLFGKSVNLNIKFL